VWLYSRVVTLSGPSTINYEKGLKPIGDSDELQFELYYNYKTLKKSFQFALPATTIEDSLIALWFEKHVVFPQSGTRGIVAV
jgi:hypothetical protein